MNGYNPMESKGRSHLNFIPLKYSGLEDIDLLEDFSVSSAFPQLDERLFQSEEDCEDILQNLLDNSTEYSHSATIALDESLSSHHQVEDENSGGCQEITPEKKDSAKSNAKGRVHGVYWINPLKGPAPFWI